MSGEDPSTCPHILEKKGPRGIKSWWQVLFCIKLILLRPKPSFPTDNVKPTPMSQKKSS